MKKLRRISLFVTAAMMTVSLMLPAMAEEDTRTAPQIHNGCVSLDAQKPLGGSEQLLESAKSALLYGLDSGTLIYAWNPDLPVDPSGMNKLMTALIALENTNPDDMVTVTRGALNTVAIGSVSAGLKAGEEISMGDLLYCMMVGSANDAAAVIAEHVGQSQEQFVTMMNDRAEELGCENTVFLNPTGLTQEGQYSTARDLAKITETALKNELFAQMFCAEKYTVPATNKVGERKIVTTNYLMSKETVKNQFDNRVTGGKTGALTTTDRSLIATAEYDGKRFLTVVMSAKGTVSDDGLSVKTFGSFEETRVLLDFGFRQYSLMQVMQSNQVLKQFAVNGGENAVACGTADDLKATLPAQTTAQAVTYQCTLNEGQLTAPIAKGQVLGSVTVWFHETCVGRTDLVALHDVRPAGSGIVTLVPDAERPVDHTFRDLLILGGLITLAVVFIAAVALVLIYLIRRYKLERRHKLINGGRR